MCENIKRRETDFEVLHIHFKRMKAKPTPIIIPVNITFACNCAKLIKPELEGMLN